jgi:ADP-heptose:LPS heptosyltransferase/2-polyprenyl-3-methyl-5-hydroxy-6-metoxy-1,4-benzoquinol methylase
MMPKIRLKNKVGAYGYGDKELLAGRIYEVDFKTASYLVNTAKVAEEILDDPAAPVKETPPNTIINDTKLRIALVRIGGLGDSIILSALAKAVRRKYSEAEITCYIRDDSARQLLQDNSDIDRIILTGNKPLQYIMEQEVTQKGYDIIYDNRYITKLIFKDIASHQEEIKKNDSLLSGYDTEWKEFPLHNNLLAKKLGVDEFTAMKETSLTDVSRDDLYIKLVDEDFNMMALLDGDKYVTIHNGADFARQTKCWPTSGWNEVVKVLKSRGYKVIQLGKQLEEPIKGAIYMAGKTTIRQTAAFISKAQFHIDTEGGLVHLAHAVRTRSIVLFGPTPVKFFGYPDNVNVETPSDCKDCWWVDDMWWRECPKKFPFPNPCMDSIKVIMVEEAIKKIEGLKPLKDEVKFNPEDINEKFALEMNLDEAHYRSEPWQMDRVQTMMARVVGKKVLEVGAGDGFCVEVLKKRGYEVTATEVSKIRLARMKEKGIDAIYADVNKLPFPDASFDTVICGEVLEHIESMGQGLKELERVCSPDGRVIISLPVADIFRTIKMHLWGIKHHSILRRGQLDMIVLEFDRINRENELK